MRHDEMSCVVKTVNNKDDVEMEIGQVYLYKVRKKENSTSEQRN